MVIFRTVGKLILGIWLLIGFGLSLIHFSARNVTTYRDPDAAPRSVAEQWEVERREAEAKARYERSY